MNKNSFRIPVFLSVLVGVLTIIAACAPVISPGVAPREITGPTEVSQFGEILPDTLPDEGLNEGSIATVDAVSLEELLARLGSISIPDIDAEFFGGVGAPIEALNEEHMVTEFPVGIGGSLDEELSGISLATVEGLNEKHMVTEFNTGIVSLEDEFLSAIELAPAEGWVIPSMDTMNDGYKY